MIYLIFILIIILIFTLFLILSYIDNKIDYTNRNILYYFFNDNGFYIRVPFLIWQENKYREIKKRFSEVIEYEGKTYIVTAIMNSQPHIPQPSDLLPVFLYKDFLANVEIIRNNKHKSFTNTTQIIGNNNTVIIQQNEINTITNNIDKLLQADINDLDKQCLELFKYKLIQNNISETDENRVLAVLTKLSKYAPYASLASAIINLIKSILP